MFNHWSVFIYQLYAILMNQFNCNLYLNRTLTHSVKGLFNVHKVEYYSTVFLKYYHSISFISSVNQERTSVCIIRFRINVSFLVNNTVYHRPFSPSMYTIPFFNQRTTIGSSEFTWFTLIDVFSIHDRYIYIHILPP